MRGILISLALVFFALPMWAQTAFDYDLCRAKDDPDNAISGCTALIQKGETDSDIFDLRALAYFAKELYGQAISDFTMAITLGPENHTYYALRGFAYEKNGQNTQAIADYRTAVKLNPPDSGAAKAALSRLKILGATP